MSWVEQFALTIVLGIVQSVVKNPAKKAAVQAALLGAADSIYEAYGVVPPVHP